MARDDDGPRDRHRRRSQSPPPSSSRRTRDRDRDRDRSPPRRSAAPLPSQQDSFALTHQSADAKPKEKANWGNTGRLAALSNSASRADGASIALKYHEPAEARKPPARDDWRLFVFKGGEVLDTLALGARSCWLIGREAAVVDLLASHPSVSGQHAVIQFRHTERRNEYGDKVGRVRPYLIDLESANGCLLNGRGVPTSRYLEIRDKDVLQFGESAREYVVMLAPKTS